MTSKLSLSSIFMGLSLIIISNVLATQSKEDWIECISSHNINNSIHLYPVWGGFLTKENCPIVKSEYFGFNYKEKDMSGFIGSTFSQKGNLQASKEGESLDGFYGELREGHHGPTITVVITDGFGGHCMSDEDEAISTLTQNTCTALCKKMQDSYLDSSRIKSPLQANWSILSEAAKVVKKEPGYMKHQAQTTVGAVTAISNSSGTYDLNFMNFGDTYAAYIKKMKDSIKWITVCSGRKNLDNTVAQFPRQLNNTKSQESQQVFYDSQIIEEVTPKEHFVVLCTDGFTDLLPKIKEDKVVDKTYLTSIFNDEEISIGVKKYLPHNDFDQLYATDMVEAARKYMMERYQEAFKASTSDKIGDDIACIIAKLPGFDEIKNLKDKEDKSNCTIF